MDAHVYRLAQCQQKNLLLLLYSDEVFMEETAQFVQHLPTAKLITAFETSGAGC